MGVITLAELKEHMDITGSDQDTDLTTQVNSTNAEIDRLTKTTWGGTLAATDELHDYAPVLFLDKIQVNSISAVKVGYGTSFTLLSSDDYRFNKLGRLLLSHDKPGGYDTYNFDEVKVTYNYGYAAVPADLKQAALDVAQSSYEDSNTSGRTVKSEKIGSRSVTYETEDVSESQAIINSYKAF